MTVEQIVNKIREFLDAQEVTYEYNEELLRFDYSFRLNGVIKGANGLLSVDEDGDGIVCIAYPEIGIDSDTRDELERMLFQLNNHQMRNLWQIDHNDEIRLVQPIALEGEDAVLTDEMLGTCFFSVLFMLEEFGKHIVSVIVGLSTADAEVERIYRKYNGEDEDDSFSIDEELPFGEELPFDEDVPFPEARKQGHEKLIEIPSEFEGGKPLYLRLKGNNNGHRG